MQFSRAVMRIHARASVWWHSGGRKTLCRTRTMLSWWRTPERFSLCVALHQRNSLAVHFDGKFSVECWLCGPLVMISGDARRTTLFRQIQFVDAFSPHRMAQSRKRLTAIIGIKLHFHRGYYSVLHIADCTLHNDIPYTHTSWNSAAKKTEPKCGHFDLVVRFQRFINHPINTRKWHVTE